MLGSGVKLNSGLKLCLSAALMTFCGSGCASTGWNADAVPLPRSTPFDSNQFARNAYLDGFGSGYRAQSSGSAQGVELISGPYAEARRQGFRAGVAHAQAEAPAAEGNPK